jgi:hypothetical protein
LPLWGDTPLHATSAPLARTRAISAKFFGICRSIRRSGSPLSHLLRVPLIKSLPC